jgi:tetratricopeptide (TPR) repeat protein
MSNCYCHPGRAGGTPIALDEAIKELPGSTGVQKLLVTGVLEHLDRMAKDTQGDRQTQLDLIDAYTRLGNIQGNNHYQNLGDPAGGLASVDKAISLAAPLAPDGSRDLKALRALATAQTSRSEILEEIARTQEGAVSIQAAIRIYDRLIATPDASTDLIHDASIAYTRLGDLLQNDFAGPADFPAALKAHRTSIALDDRALAIDPNYWPAKHGLEVSLMAIGRIEMGTDPALALKDFQTALQLADTVPEAEQSDYSAMVTRLVALRGKAEALVQLGEYSEATAPFTEVSQKFQRLAAADPQNLRALVDLQRVLDTEAQGFEAAADPALGASPSDRRRNLAAAEKLLIQVVAIWEKMIKQYPSTKVRIETLADAQVRLGTIQSILHIPGDSGATAKKGIASLEELARKDQASSTILDMTASDLLMVKPASLRDPQFAVACAERAVALSQRKQPTYLLTLAQAYRASGQTEKSIATAREGLALLPAPQQGSVKPRIRKLLEIQLLTNR